MITRRCYSATTGYFFARESWCGMSRRVSKASNTIKCAHGVTWVDFDAVKAIYKYRVWFLRVNPRLLLPNFRREHRKMIIINGKNRGYGEVRSGYIPLSRYKLPGKGLIRNIQQFIREKFGLLCKRYEKGYIYLKVVGFKFLVLQRVTEQGLTVCEVFDKLSEEQVGTFIFNKDFSEVNLLTNNDGYTKTLHVIIGYVADSMVYSIAASNLIKNIKVQM